MTAWQKLKIGPRHHVDCGSCGRKVSVSNAAVVTAVVPVTIGAFIAYASASLTLGTAAILTGGAAAVWVYVYAVPIVGRDA
jgi:hypothetical protein